MMVAVETHGLIKRHVTESNRDGFDARFFDLAPSAFTRPTLAAETGR